MLKFLKSPFFAVLIVAFAAAVFVFTGVVGCQREEAPGPAASEPGVTPAAEARTDQPASPSAEVGPVAVSPLRSASDGALLETGGEVVAVRDPIVRPTRVALPDPKIPALEGPQLESEPEGVEPAEAAVEIVEALADLTVVSGRLAKDVVKRAPIDASDRFVADGSSVWAWVKVKNPGAQTHIWMNWRKGDKIYSRVRLRVGKSSGWRTWSRHRMRTEASVGEWVVEVRTDDGELLDTMAFVVASSEVVGADAAPEDNTAANDRAVRAQIN
ncbi:MAG: hypothetical protein ACI9OJ_001032 [Myxococcota bacterium]|jgi:hypothetical protein